MLTGIEEQIVLLRLFSGRLKENSYFSRRGQTFVFFTDLILLHLAFFLCSIFPATCSEIKLHFASMSQMSND